MLQMLLLPGILFADDSRHFIVTSDVLKLIDGKPRVVQSSGDHTLVRLSDSEITRLARRIHEDKGICGGFKDIEHQLSENGLTAQKAFQLKMREEKSRFSPQGLLRKPNFSRTTLLYPTQVKAALALTDKSLYKNILATLSSQNDRHSKSPSGPQATVLARQMFTDNSAGHTIKLTNIPTSGPYIMDTLVATIEGSDPNLPGLVIGGHLDTFKNNKPGADDDATGAATVIASFAALAKSGMTFKRSIHFALYSAEEYGLVGSQRMVDDYVKKGISILAALQFDMTGFHMASQKEAMFLVTDYTDPGLNLFLRQLAMTYLELAPELIGSTRCGYACSDHASWMDAGVPAAIPFESSFNGMNMALHTSSDTMSLLDLEHAFRFVKLGVSYLVELAEPL